MSSTPFPIPTNPPPPPPPDALRSRNLTLSYSLKKAVKFVAAWSLERTRKHKNTPRCEHAGMQACQTSELADSNI